MSIKHTILYITIMTISLAAQDIVIVSTNLDKHKQTIVVQELIIPYEHIRYSPVLISMIDSSHNIFEDHHKSTITLPLSAHTNPGSLATIFLFLERHHTNNLRKKYTCDYIQKLSIDEIAHLLSCIDYLQIKPLRIKVALALNSLIRNNSNFSHIIYDLTSIGVAQPILASITHAHHSPYSLYENSKKHKKHKKIRTAIIATENGFEYKRESSSGNPFTNSFLPEVLNLSRYQLRNLNGITDLVENPKHITSINLYGNQLNLSQFSLDDEIDNPLEPFTHLESLDYRKNKGIFPLHWLAHMPNFHKLVLDNNQIKGTPQSVFATLDQLQYLCLVEYSQCGCRTYHEFLPAINNQYGTSTFFPECVTCQNNINDIFIYETPFE